MLKRRQLMIFALVSVASLPVVLANVPRSETSNDTAIYQNLHEIKVSRANSLDFDSDINKLSAQEKSHREALPLRVSTPMNRVMNTKYRPGPNKQQKPVQKTRYTRDN